MAADLTDSFQVIIKSTESPCPMVLYLVGYLSFQCTVYLGMQSEHHMKVIKFEI